MNRGVWIGGLFLSLCAWAGQAGAQDVVWRPAARPSGPAPAQAAPALLPLALREAPPAAGAALGRPLPMKPAEPDAGAAAVIAASYRMAAAPTPVPRAWPAGLDGLDDTGLIADAAAEGGAFAADRAVRPAVYKAEPIAVAPKPGAAPPEAAPGPAFPPPAACAPPAPESPDLFQGAEAWRPGFYARAEYLLWRVKKDSVPPLITTSAPQDFGFLSGRTTRILFGGDGLDGGTRSGARFTAGLWLDDCQTKAVEVSGFFLGSKSGNFEANSSQFPVIARPFFSLNRNMEFSQLTAFPNAATGNAQVHNSSNLWGLEANLRCNLCCGQTCPEDWDCGPGWDYRLDALAGFRYLDLREDLAITEHVLNMPSPSNMLRNLGGLVFDDFATQNQFYGAQVGLNGVIGRGPWSLDVTAKLAVGDTRQEVKIQGGQRLNFSDGTTRNFVGGLLALPSNIGVFHKNSFSVVPEIDLTASYHVNEHVRLFAGYDLLYWSSVVRPGQQIDRSLDETLIPNFDPPGTIAPVGQNRPAVLFRQSDFWAQGLNLGLEFRY